MPFATTDELAGYLQRSLDAYTANLALEAVADQIVAEVGWSVLEEAAVQQKLDGPAGRGADLTLPTLHLTAVTSVVEDEATLAADTDYLWYPNGVLTRVSGGYKAGWTPKPQGVVVTFNHGYATADVPGIFRTVNLEYAAPVYDNALRLKAKTVGGVSLTYADVRAMVGGVGDARLSRYTLRGFA